MVQPLNLTARASAYIMANASHPVVFGTNTMTPSPHTVKSIMYVADRMATSPNFQLPDDGVILPGKLSGIRNCGFVLKLPFDSIAISFRFGKDAVGPGYYDSVCLLATDHIHVNESICSDAIYVFAAVNSYDRWVLMPIMIEIKPDEWESPETRANEASFAFRADQFIFYDVDVLSDKKFVNDIACLALPVFALMEALSCSNVSYEKIQESNERINSKRIKSGKIPLNDIYALTVKVPIRTYSKVEHGGTHNSPREHLRRGHIRKLSSGERIWVNPCVVNPGHGERIDKLYRITT